MATKNHAVYGIYPDQATARDAVEALKAAGFRSTDISVLVPENVGSKDFAHERHTKAPEGAVTGGGVGAVAGAALGWLAASGMMMVPGLDGMVHAAGPILSTLAGLGGGVVLGGVTGGLFGMGIPEYEAKRYAGRIRRGGILLSVHCDDEHWTGPAKSIMTKTGATDIGVRSEGKADFAHNDKPLPRQDTVETR